MSRLCIGKKKSYGKGISTVCGYCPVIIQCKELVDEQKVKCSEARNNN